MPKSFIGAKVLIVGGGISGKGARFALTARGATCFMFDDAIYTTIPKVQFDYIVVSPSITPEHHVFEYARINGIPLIGELELGYIFNEGIVIAITGTNGKTTVTELITDMLNGGGISAIACGNIGISFAETAVKDEYNVAVVETSSFQLETINSFKPHIAAITNISGDHLDRHKTMENYIKAKLSIALNQTADDYLILSQDDIPLHALQNFFPKCNVMYTSLRGKVLGAYVLNSKIYYLEEEICDVQRVKLMGAHNLSNVLTAVCVAKLSDVDNSAIIKVLSNFQANQHRIKYVTSINGTQYYNDSKGTNILATKRACEALSGDICLLAGGSDKGYEYDELFANLSPFVKRIILIGETAQKIQAAAYRNKFFEVLICQNLNDAVKAAAEGKYDNVLLSPASASFDMFKNYKDRGEQFESIVWEQSKQID